MMVRSIVAVITLAAIAGCGERMPDFAHKSEVPVFRTARIERTDVVRTVEATGTITPRNTPNGIPVGAQVNGKIIRMLVDYNSIVTNGQIVALIDPQVYEANYKSAIAQLHSAQANVKVREADLALAEKTFTRKDTLVERDMASKADFDSAVQSRDSALAQLEAAKAQVEQAEAAAEQAKANLDYCTIRSPVNGIVIDRKVEEGETVVSSMNAVPVLTIAEDLETVWVEATVPEADIGMVKVGQPVVFTADAYRRRFTGTVKQVRIAAETVNNVVTYPVIIEAANPDTMLFPGMTATLSIETARVEAVPAVGAAAFRFRPRDEDRVEGEIPRGRKLWFADDAGKLSPIVVEEGVSDDMVTEIVCEDAAALVGREVVIGYETAASAAAKTDTTNPFMPKMPQRNKNKGTAPEPKK